MAIAKMARRKRFWMISLVLCLGTGIGLLFHKRTISFSKVLHPDVLDTIGDGTHSRANNVSRLRLHFHSTHDNLTTVGIVSYGDSLRLKNSNSLRFHIQSHNKSITIYEQNAIFKRFKELNDSYALRLIGLKSVVYEDKSKFVKAIAPSTNTVSLDTGDSRNSNDTKFILLWTLFFGRKHWIHTDEFRNCKSKCVVTTNKDDVSRSSAIMMHSLDLGGLQGLPKTRHPHQRWVYHVMESPNRVYLDLKEFNNIWNMTFTYRSDSDLFGGYGSMGPHNVPIDDQTFGKQLNNLVNSKTKLVAARISNCENKYTSRVAYIRELQKYIGVDFYGSCGDLTCPKGEEKCETELMKKYKFFLTFENNNCRDYITEKFWRALRTWNSVPIVMGGSRVEDYLRVTPPYSFIHVDGFESPKQLAEYIKFMNDHPDYYALLHYWRKYYKRTDNDRCPFCEMLHNQSAYGQSYTDFHGWYNQDICRHRQA